ncbi:MAG: choice-of-anchor J domain-containing protein [Bacteroidetes bacterium]|nr:choice-of-anchor J domain-containing protein [Bacteroidota bacterium]MBU1720628.1 choice-of-anchor J domain-containing protein [Bacteroidota bacterium]
MKKHLSFFLAFVLISSFAYAQSTKYPNANKAITGLVPVSQHQAQPQTTHQQRATILFEEDFQGGTMPGTFTLHNVDGLTPATAMSFVTDAWVVRKDYVDTMNYVAASTSWYTPAGQADDWMITPQITLTTSCFLKWSAKAQDPSYPDGYQVLLSTTGTNVVDFTTTLFTTVAEESDYTVRMVDLAAYNGQSVYIAFRNNSTDQFVLLVDEISVFVADADDAAVLSFSSPHTGCELTAAETVSIAVKNYGMQTITTCDLSFQFDGGVVVTETYNGSIPFDSTIIYDFTQTVDMTGGNPYDSIVAWVTLTGDADTSNDTTDYFYLADIVPSAIPYTMGFESSEAVYALALDDANDDGDTWGIANSATYAHSGTNFAYYAYNSTNAANDWIITTCLDLVGGTAYQLEFYYAVSTAAYPEKLKVAYGTAPNAASLTTDIVDLGTISDTAYALSVSNFTPATSGTYYIGFKAYSDADMDNIFLDDVSLDLYTGVNGNATEDIISIFPNPATDAVSIYAPAARNVLIMNATGQVVTTAQSSNGNFHVNTTNFANGIYFVQIESNNGMVTKRFAITK